MSLNTVVLVHKDEKKKNIVGQEPETGYRLNVQMAFHKSLGRS